MATVASDHPTGRPWAGYLLGFALGGFFDGILLHQILQWHHLLLAIQTGPFQDIRTQILADGLFHLLMYAIALAGLWSLLRWRRDMPLSAKELIADALIGFGAWHVLDAIISHWVLGIHRIKMDSPNPLLWDLLWFFVFGIGFILLGFLIRNRADAQRPSGGAPAIPAMLVIVVLTAGIVAALPPQDVKQVAVLVRPADANKLLDGLREVDGGILWGDRTGALWVFNIGERARPERLYDHGAVLVARSPAVLGCLAWVGSKKRMADSG